jgi:hypothetical protein
MPNNTNSNPALSERPIPLHPETTTLPVKDMPGTKADDATVKNPMTPETSGATRADRAANKAAHKAAEDEKAAESDKTIFTH